MRRFVPRSASSCPSCATGHDDPLPSRRPGLAHRGAHAGAWLVPGTLLALLPKCPLCLAAYVALFTGASLSVETAARLRLLLAALSVGALAFLALRTAQRRVAHRRIHAQR